MKGKAIGAVGLVVVLSWANWAFSQERAKSLPPPPVKVWRDLPYMEHGGPRNRLDLYLPENVSGPLPLVVWVHPRRMAAGEQGALSRGLAGGQGLRRRQHQLSLGPGRRVPRRSLRTAKRPSAGCGPTR